MDRQIKSGSLLQDIRCIGGVFFIPFATTLAGALFLIFGFGKDASTEVFVKKYLGVASFPFVCIWVLGLLEDLTESEGRECLLCLPYKSFPFGVVRVVRLTFVYIMIFFAFFFAVLTMNASFDKIGFVDIVFPTVSILFFSSFAFILAVVVKHSLVSYSVIGTFSITAYFTRGAFSALVYPFQWALPNPFFENGHVIIVLALLTIQ